MKKGYCVLILTLTACGSNNPQEPNLNIQPPVGSASQIVVKDGKDHYTAMDTKDVSAVDVWVYDGNSGNQHKVGRHFAGSVAQQVVQSIGLNKPSLVSSYSGCVETGEVSVYFSTRSDGRKFDILNNGCALFDETYSEMTYRTSRKLDIDWLNAFPGK